VVSTLSKHVDVLHDGSVQLEFRVLAQGKVENVRIISYYPNTVVTEACVRAVKAAKLPPIPSDVLKEQGRNWLDVSTEISTAR
jgi:TonB family protein